MIVMQRHEKKYCAHRRALVVFIITTFICAPLHAAEKTLSKDTARKAIMRVAGLQLKKSAVEIKQVSGANAPVEVAATIKTAFHFERRGDGSWQVVEARVGDRQWEDIDLLARAWQFDRTSPVIAQLEQLAAQLEAREQTRAAEKKRHKQEDEALSKEQRKQKQPKTAPSAPEDFRAGPFVGKTFASLLSSATVEAELDMTFRLTRDAHGAWQATEARLGDGAWQDVAMLVRALDTEKIGRARADLAALAAALEAFHRERGFYVVADTSAALVDQLNPRYTPAVIRIDPWHRPYEYTGTRDNYTLRSLGPDGKPNTADDVEKTMTSDR